MKYSVMINGRKEFYAAPSYEDAETVAEGIITGNRWAQSVSYTSRGPVLTIEAHDGQADPTPLADKVFWWDCYIGVHYSGWNVVPLCESDSNSGGQYEQVISRERDNKRVIVTAASALDAIAKAELYLFKG